LVFPGGRDKVIDLVHKKTFARGGLKGPEFGGPWGGGAQKSGERGGKRRKSVGH